jgi:hypothetical protein
MSKETRERTVSYEILKVPSPSGQPHTILITTMQTESTYMSGVRPHRLGTFEVSANYLSGPLARERMLNQALVSKMGGDADTLNNRVKITQGVVEIHVVALRGLGIGTFLFAKVVQWAIAFDPSLEVASIKVGSGDATEENQVRRNFFYANFGILFSDSESVESVVAGRSLPMHASELIPYEGWKTKVEVITVNQRLVQMEDEIGSLRSTNADLTRNVRAKEQALVRRDNSKKQLLKFYGFIIMAMSLALAWKW